MTELLELLLMRKLLEAEHRVIVQDGTWPGKNGWKFCVLCGEGNIVIGDVDHAVNCPITLAKELIGKH